MLRRNQLLCGTAAFAAWGLMGASKGLGDDETALAQVRRGNFGAAPFSRIREDVTAGIFAGWTSNTVQLIRSGAGANRIGRRYARENRYAELYAVDGAQTPYFLIVRQGDTLTDIAAGWSAAPSLALTLTGSSADPPSYIRHGLAQRITSGGAPGPPWRGAVTAAIELAVKSAWPEFDTSNGMRSGWQVGGPSSYAINATKESWLRLRSDRQRQVLRVLASAVTRVYGLAPAGPNEPDVEVTVGIQELDPPSSNGRTGQTLVSESYLAQEPVKALDWESAPVD